MADLADLLNHCDIRIVADKYLSPAKNHTYVCPICGAGTHGNHNTGLSYYEDKNTGLHKLKCFACQKNFSVMDLICHCENLQPRGADFVKALKIGCDIFGVDFDNPQIDAPPTYTAKVDSPAEKVQFSRFPESLDRLKNFCSTQGGKYRGIPSADYSRANVGYLPDLWFKCDEQKHPAFIFQNDLGNFFCRAVDATTAKHFIGTTSTFSLNIPTTDVENSTVLIVESAIDALSILHATNWQVYVIATGGINGLNQLKQTLKRLYPDVSPNLLLMLDNDENPDGANPGQNAASKWIKELLAAGYPVLNRVLTDEKNLDFNAYLIRYGVEALKFRIEKIIADAQVEFVELRNEISAQQPLKTARKSNIEELQAEKQDVEKQISDLELQSENAIEFLRDALNNFEKFDSNAVFADEVVTSAAYAKIFARQVYSDFARALKNYGDEHPTEKVNINDWKAVVKGKADDINYKRKTLTAQRNKIRAAIETEKFLADNPINFSIPADYSVSLGGVYKIVDDTGKLILACRRPVIIAAKTKSVEDKKIKLILQYWKIDGKPVMLPPVPASAVFNRAGIVELTNDGLITSSHTSSWFVDYLDAFNAQNEDKIPITYTVPRCGWHNLNGKNIFVDPRRLNTITDDGASYPLVVDSSSQFASCLTKKGTLSAWKEAYALAKQSTVARGIVAACISSPLIKILKARNFLFYVKAHSLAGKTTGLILGASAIGSEKIIRTFDATKNGFVAAAADVSDYSFLVDEKQSADKRMSEQLSLIVYALANGIGRTKLSYNKLNKDWGLKKLDDWQTIAVMTGETDLLNDGANDGAINRLLPINAPATILSPEACRKIRAIAQDNYGLVMPLVIDKICSYGDEKLRGYYEEDFQPSFANNFPETNSEYRGDVAVLALGDFILNVCLGVDEETAFVDALDWANNLFDYIPTQKEIDTTQKEIDLVTGFIAQNQAYFYDRTVEVEADKIKPLYGEIEQDGKIVYITVPALKLACEVGGYPYSKVVDDLVADGRIIPSNKIPAGRKTPPKFQQKKLGKINTNCYKFVNPADSADDEE